MAFKPVKVGVIGCGNISGIYFQMMKTFDILEVAACADMIPERAQEAAKMFDVPKVCSVEELLADPEIEIVLNLTIPNAHYSVAKAALEAGKSVHNEKPMAIKREEGLELLELAQKKGLRVGGAPDTFLGGGIQTCRKLIDDGVIGEPIGATAFMACHGHESWHPDPEFYYKIGGGPVFDMGPYYITALVNLIGPVKRATGMARITFPERMITSEPKNGTMMKVETPTNVVSVLEFANGAIGNMIMSFDIWAAALPRIEIYGEKGSISVPDPNCFGVPVQLSTAGGEWTDVPLTHGYTENTRSIGVADMAYGLRTGRKHRTNGGLTYHVLDIMHAVHDAAREGKHIDMASTCERPAALPVGLPDGKLDE